MPVISLSNVTKAFGTQVVIENATVAVNAGDRIGVVGANGTGKTTLLRLMAALDEPTQGEVHVGRGARIGFLEQEPDFGGHGTVLDVALSAFARVHELEAAIADLRERLAADPPDAERLLRRQGELEHEFERLGGYTIRSRAEAVLHGLGFAGDAVDGPVDTLSGGERSRLAIAHLLLQDADVLLLDEPTNHLDVAGLEWLEGFLGGQSGAAVVVSHDRRFLDGYAQRIIEVGTNAALELYKGNYAAYVTQSAERAARHRKLFDLQQKRIAKEAEFIQRYISGVRGKEAKGRRRRLERLERIAPPPKQPRTIHVRIPPVARGGNEVLNLAQAAKAFGDRTLFQGLDLQVLRGDRIGVVGPNGAGKTTLLRCIVGEEQLTGGTARLGHGIDVGYYRQDRLDLDPARTVLDEVWSRAPRSRAGELRSLLGLFLFSEDDVFKTVGDLSGGEQARVALAKLILSGPNFLLLDEPTNHLDIPSRLCLEDALNAYEGTVLLVSHDRYVLDRVADKTLEIKDGQARLFHGGYSHYVARLRQLAAERKDGSPGGRPATPPAAAARPRRAKRRTRPLEVVEKLIFEREEAIGTLHHAMSDPEIYKSPDTVRTLAAQLENVRRELASLYDEWDEAAER